LQAAASVAVRPAPAKLARGTLFGALAEVDIAAILDEDNLGGFGRQSATGRFEWGFR